MTVESNCAIVFATLTDWLKKSRTSISANEKKDQNQLHLVGAIFPALWTSYRSFLAVLIGSSHCLLLLWLVGLDYFSIGISTVSWKQTALTGETL